MLLQQGQHFQEQIKYDMLTQTCSPSRLKLSHCSSAVEVARVAEDGERGAVAARRRRRGGARAGRAGRAVGADADRARELAHPT